MSLFGKLFNRKNKKESNGEDSNKQELPWITADASPWGVPILDLRAISQSMLSTSKDPLMASNAVSYGGEDGTTFFGQLPSSNKTIESTLVYPLDKILLPGVLFTPDTMEHKWAIFYDGELIYFVRSWHREVTVVAKTVQEDNQLYIKTIQGEFTEDEDPAFTEAALNFILISHVNDEIIPAPLPKEMKLSTYGAGLWSFSTYGNLAHLGIFDYTFRPFTQRPLRSHSLIHIAVARADISKIDELAAKGFPLDGFAQDGLTVMHWALATEGTGVIEHLISLGVDPDIRSLQGATALMNAVQSKKMDAINFLIAEGADVNAKDKRGFTALHRAAEMGYLEIVELLLSKGADKSVDAEGHTPMSLAQMQNHQEIVNLFN